MSIVEQLRKLIVKRGGSATGVMTISDAVKVLTSLENESAQQESDHETT